MSESREEQNPYAPPEADLVGPEAAPSSELSEMEAIRKRYLSHEASVKSLGSLFDLSALISGVVIVVAIISTASGQRIADPATIAGLGFWVVALALNIALGRGLKGLKPWARWVTAALVSLSLLISIGSTGVLLAVGGRPVTMSIFVLFGQALIPGYILYLLVSRKGSYVFSSEYSDIVRATPHIKYKTSCILKAALGLIVFVLIIVFVSVLTRGS